MIVEVIMPKTGIYDGDVSLVEWLVDHGSHVEVGDPLFIMETEKVEVEIEADDAGILFQSLGAGTIGPVGTTIGWLASTPDELEELRLRTAP